MTLYDIDWSKIQLTAITGGFSYYANAGHATSRGAEISAAWRPVHGLKLGLTSSLNDAKIDKLLSGVSTNFVTGAQTPGSPKVTVAGTVDYTFNLFSDVRGAVGGNVKYIDKENDSAAQSGASAQPLYVNPAYTTGNLYASLNKGPYTARLYVRNVTDSHASTGGSVTQTLIGSFYGANAPGAYYGIKYPLQPRTIGFGLDVAF